MPIPLSPQTRPSIKLPMIGAWCEVAVIGTRRVPWSEYQTGAAKIGRNGQPRKQLRVTGILINHSGANTGTAEAPVMPQPGEVVDIYAHGHQWGAWIDAEKALRTSGQRLDVGDVILFHYVRDEPSQMGQPKRVRIFGFRKPRPDEMGRQQEAERQYYALGFDKPDTDDATAPDLSDDGAGPFDGGQPPQQGYPQQGYPQSPGWSSQPQYGAPPQQTAPQPPPQPMPTSPPGYGFGGGQQQPGQVAQQPVPAAPPPGGYDPGF